MKRTLAALLAALLILALTACKPKSEPEPIPDPPAVTQPDTPAPEPTPEPEPEPTPETPDLGLQAELSEYVLEDSVEETVGYRLTMPQVTLPNAEAAEIINQYYRNIAGKLGDLAWGEAYEQAISQHLVMELTSPYTIQMNQNGILSIRRQVKLADKTNATDEATLLAETFDLESGGLLTLDDLFKVPETEYLPRILDKVRSDIEDTLASSPHAFVQSWESQVEAAFDKTQFSLSDVGVEVFYQAGELDAKYAYSFTIPWQDLSDITKKP